MIRMLTYNHKKDELERIYDITKYKAALLTDDVWNIGRCLLYSECLSFIKHNPMLDIICFDVTESNGIEHIEELRKKYSQAYIILLADLNISPVKYMKPTIMAASLLLRPFNDTNITDVIEEMMEAFKREDNSGKVFIIDDEDGRNRIPYSSILYFESKEKKVFLCTDTRQYGFYNTIEHLSEELPDNFKRCHRSYIVNTDYISKVILTENLIYLTDDSVIPLSRSYRNVMKEYKYGK